MKTLKKEQVLLLSETVREKDVFQLLCRLSRLRQKRLLWWLPSGIFQRVKGLKTASSWLRHYWLLSRRTRYNPHLKSKWLTIRCLHGMAIVALHCTY